METKENQRVKLTKQLLSEALIKMLQEMPIHTISIRELCQRAGVNKSTFYNHYGSQYDLLEDITRRFLETIAGQLSVVDAYSRDSVLESVSLVFAYLAEHLALSRLLLNVSASPDFAERVFSLPKINELFNASLKECSDADMRNAVISFALHGSCRLLREWINREERRPPTEQAALILELAGRVCAG